MARDLRNRLIVNGIFAALLFGAEGSQLVLALRTERAEVAAVLQPPSILFAGTVLVMTAAALALAVGAALQKKPSSSRAFRMLPILLAVTAFVEIFVMGSVRAPMTPDAELEVALGQFAIQTRTLIAPGGKVSEDLRALQRSADALPAPPYRVHGRLLERYQVELRPGCAGPAERVDGAAAGTLVYCVAEDKKRAWVTAVALPAEERWGKPALFTRAGKVISTDVK